ncbi:IS66 family insertion sequence element accessory protein TnpB [Bradyrhizobium sp. SZCCHNR2035]|uniref:IS66 family insertion sequence element accessory protein TnpB n=1 Tax=Bradyrhizobium sp. SZCCHNR2035 TaxID=3057386 RepID=UPI0029164F48|nr:IS66 family insertion sequence element accessory protein TnpB [Bradyrhizobium sp. SZCCHNR2035]
MVRWTGAAGPGDPQARSADGQLFVLRGPRGNLINVLWHHGQGMCLFSKRLEHGRSSGRRKGGDRACPTRVSPKRDRLAVAVADLAAGGSGLSAGL